MSKKYAIILAGGTGTRMGTDIPKQFLHINNKPVIVYTIEAFQNHPVIDGIIIVIHADYKDQVERLKIEYELSKIIRIIPGGETRQGSSYNAVNGYNFMDDDILLFHDAVRPFVTGDIIDECVKETLKYGAAGVCVKTTDTIVQSSTENFIESMPDRDSLRNEQTPQCFKYKIIREAHEKAREDNYINATDDVRLLLNIGRRVKIVEGSYENIKITTAGDLALAEAIVCKRKEV